MQDCMKHYFMRKLALTYQSAQWPRRFGVYTLTKITSDHLQKAAWQFTETGKLRHIINLHITVSGNKARSSGNNSSTYCPYGI